MSGAHYLVPQLSICSSSEPSASSQSKFDSTSILRRAASASRVSLAFFFDAASVIFIPCRPLLMSRGVPDILPYGCSYGILSAFSHYCRISMMGTGISEEGSLTAHGKERMCSCKTL